MGNTVRISIRVAAPSGTNMRTDSKAFGSPRASPCTRARCLAGAAAGRNDVGPTDPLLVVRPVRSVHHEVPLPADAELEGPRGGGEPLRSPPSRDRCRISVNASNTSSPSTGGSPGRSQSRGRRCAASGYTGAPRPIVLISYSLLLCLLRGPARTRPSVEALVPEPLEPAGPLMDRLAAPRASRPYRRCLPTLRSRTSPTSRSTRGV